MSTLCTAANYSVNLDSPRVDRRQQRYEELVKEHSRSLFRYAYWMAGNRQTAEDLVQETFLRAWRSLDSLANNEAAKGWLFTILRRENARRFERHRPEIADVPLELIGAEATDYDTSTEAHVLRNALKGLPEEYRQPLMLQVIGGYSQKEIATLLGISSAGVGTRLFRARQKLRQVLEG